MPYNAGFDPGAIISTAGHGVINYLVIDAFASAPFSGNPAAVVLMGKMPADDLLQSIAGEFNLAETAFPCPAGDAKHELRWFTPTREVPLCGHATLAAAYALWRLEHVDADKPIRFITRSSGELVCVRRDDGWIQMDFPATPPAPVSLPPNAAAVLGIAGPVECVGATTMNLTLRLPDEEQVRRSQPDLATLATWHPVGVTITAPAAKEGVDFVSRFFAPAAGVPEDPVTGSSHCALAPYWAKVMGRQSFVACQLSKRGGELRIELHGDRVHLFGQAVMTMRGILVV